MYRKQKDINYNDFSSTKMWSAWTTYKMQATCIPQHINSKFYLFTNLCCSR